MAEEEDMGKDKSRGLTGATWFHKYQEQQRVDNERAKQRKLAMEEEAKMKKAMEEMAKKQREEEAKRAPYPRPPAVVREDEEDEEQQPAVAAARPPAKKQKARSIMKKPKKRSYKDEDKYVELSNAVRPVFQSAKPDQRKDIYNIMSNGFIHGYSPSDAILILPYTSHLST